VRLEQRGIPATRISVVPNGLDLDAIDAAAPSERAVGVLYVGRLLAHKHVDWLLEALASLRDRGTALTCAVVGEGPERPRLEEQARAHGLAESVTFLGNVEDQGQIYGLMKAASVFALPSTREGFGIVVAEAIACGTPVVTTDHPDNHSQSLLREGVTGRICHASPTALADAIVDAIAISETSVRSERPALEGLSWSAGAKRIFDVLTAELDARRPAVHRA
jgi:glycosyltransferase involved in cell wall biosynthesis